MKDSETSNVRHLATMLIFHAKMVAFLTVPGRGSCGPSLKEASLYPIFAVIQLQKQQKQHFAQIIQKCLVCLLSCL